MKKTIKYIICVPKYIFFIHFMNFRAFFVAKCLFFCGIRLKFKKNTSNSDDSQWSSKQGEDNTSDSSRWSGRYDVSITLKEYIKKWNVRWFDDVGWACRAHLIFTLYCAASRHWGQRRKRKGDNRHKVRRSTFTLPRKTFEWVEMDETWVLLGFFLVFLWVSIWRDRLAVKNKIHME